MKIAIGSDHGGYRLKEAVLTHLRDTGRDVTDFGTDSEDACDYNDIAIDVAQAVSSGRFDRGILICGTGIGMSIQANRNEGVRAALVHDVYSAEATRSHNDANILAMGGRVIAEGPAKKIVETWLETPFSGESRHIRRIEKLKG